MDKREALVRFLYFDRGKTEFPPGSNIVNSNDWYYDVDAKDCDYPRFFKAAKAYQAARKQGNAKAFAWCGTDVAYSLHFGLQDYGFILNRSIHYRLYYVPLVQNYLEANGYETKEPLKGDIVIFDFDKDNSEDHIGFFIKWANEEKTKFITIEANTSSDDSGSQSNGGGKFEKIRNIKHVKGFYNLIDKN